uniref:GEVED domain-containing protein n=1 Tax=Thiofilum flexile TaxID=125627 RepID=UPI000594989D
DGFTTFPSLFVNASSYSLPMILTNTTGTAGRLHGWMDLDGNGVFDSDEYTSVAVPTGSNKAAIALNWSSLPDLRAGSTFMRLRLTTGTLTATDATTSSSTINGEVEDYQITVVDPDPDHDGLTTALELVLGTNPFDADTDDDGISDGAEDANKNGVIDAGETSPLDADSDNDGIQDGTERGVTTPIPGGINPGNPAVSYLGTDTAVFIPDSDPTTKTDPLDSDTDNDGLLDGQEDVNNNGKVDAGETNPLDADSDDDGLSDGAEDANKNGVVDAGETSPLKADTDNDGLQDGTEKGVTTAIAGGTSSGSTPVSYVGTNTTVFIPDSDSATKTDPLDADTDNDGLLDGQEDANKNGAVTSGETSPLDADTDDDGLSDGAEDANKNGVVDAGETSPIKVDTDNDGLQDGTEKGVTTTIAGGTSSGSTPVSYVGTDTAIFIPDSNSTTKTDPLDADTDNDGLLDGVEDANKNGVVDAGETNPLDADSDDDGLSDGAEDANKNGVVDAGETNPLNVDTDSDGLQDGTEKGVTSAIAGGTSSGSTPVSYVGTDTAIFIPDSGSASKTDPLDADSDNDGLLDGQEDANHNGRVDSGETKPLDNDSDEDGLSDGAEDANRNGTVDAGETSPLDADSDNDGLQDGTEQGVTTAMVGGTSDGTSISYSGTSAAFIPDSDPSTTTDPLNPDTDNGGICDGSLAVTGVCKAGEDANNNGVIDSGETDPNLAADDSESTALKLQLRVMLQGAYNPTTGLMRDDLRTRAILPLEQPYAAIAAYAYTGTETTNSTVLAVTGSDAAVDWVLVELLDSTGTTVVARQAALLQRDGDLMDSSSGSVELQFAGLTAGDYQIILRHRNHLDIRTLNAVSLNTSTVTLVDFTLSSTLTLGTYSRQESGSLAFMWMGDANINQSVIGAGPDLDTNVILGQVFTAPENTNINTNYILAGYYTGDLNLDGDTIFSGPDNDVNLIIANIMMHPLNSTLSANYVLAGGLRK